MQRGVIIAMGILLAAPAARAEEPPADRAEWGVLPALAYDSDIGFGFGAVGTLARFEEGYTPYRWRIEAQAFSSARLDEEDDVIVPFHDHYLSLDMPGLADGVLRMEAAIGFSRFTHNGYYGLGGDSEVREDADATYHFYDRIFPTGDLNFRLKILDRTELLIGGHGSYNWINPYPGSKLLEDADALHGIDDHAQIAVNLGILYDTRDHEFAPTRGTFSEVSTRLSPGPGDTRYGTVFLSSRWFAPLWDEYLVVGGRIAVDAIYGHPPVYELRNFGVLEREAGPGGSGSVRGVLLHRYHDDLKLIANGELRGNAPWFEIGSERMRVGAVAFADVARVTATTPVGVGGGVRLQWGETFIIRGDFGYSPTDETTGIYVDVGHVF